MGKGFDAYIKTRLSYALDYVRGIIRVGEEMPFSDLMEMAQGISPINGVPCEDFERNLLRLLETDPSYMADIERKVFQRL